MYIFATDLATIPFPGVWCKGIRCDTGAVPAAVILTI